VGLCLVAVMALAGLQQGSATHCRCVQDKRALLVDDAEDAGSLRAKAVTPGHRETAAKPKCLELVCPVRQRCGGRGCCCRRCVAG
jgi:hypothetical protein